MKNRFSFEPDIESQNLLLRAVKRNKLKDAQKAIEEGFDVNHQDDRGASILMWATYKTNLDFIKYLISKGADYTLKGRIDVAPAIYYGSIMGIAAGERKHEMLRYFIEELSIDVNDKENESGGFPGWTALQYSIAVNDLIAVRYLLGKKADPNPEYYRTSSLYDPIKNNNIEMFDLLIKHGSIIYDTPEKSSIYVASAHENKYFLEIILMKGIDPNLRSVMKKFTPLMFAASNNRINNCKVLIEYGAKKDLESYTGQTALTMAKNAGNTKIVKFLESI